MNDTQPKKARKRYRFKSRDEAERMFAEAESKSWNRYLAMVDLIAGRVEWLESTVEQEGEHHRVRLGMLRLTGADGGLVIVEHRTLGEACSPNTEVWRLDDYRKAIEEEAAFLSFSPVRYAALRLIEQALAKRREARDVESRRRSR